MTWEEILKLSREYWIKCSLDSTKYQNKCRLIWSWGELIKKLNEHINSLKSMNLSPYYKVFEEEVGLMDERWRKLWVLFDIWINA